MGEADGPIASGSVEAERRKASREELVVRVDYHTVDELFSDFACNINEGGIFVESENPPPVGTEVQLQFRLPGCDEPVSARGTVVHHEDGDGSGSPGMGIEFGALDARTRERIDRLVRQLRSS